MHTLDASATGALSATGGGITKVTGAIGVPSCCWQQAMLQFAMLAAPCLHCIARPVSLFALPCVCVGTAQRLPSQQDALAGQAATASGAYRHNAAKMHIHAGKSWREL
jgi:hypothetical protein